MDLNQVKKMAREEARGAMGRELAGRKEKGRLVEDDGLDIMGYEPITTLWRKFSRAEKFGEIGVIHTYGRIKSEWDGDYKYWTELCMVLDHKSWRWCDKGNLKRAEIYGNLWKDADKIARRWTGEKRKYYLSVSN